MEWDTIASLAPRLDSVQISKASFPCCGILSVTPRNSNFALRTACNAWVAFRKVRTRHYAAALANIATHQSAANRWRRVGAVYHAQDQKLQSARRDVVPAWQNASTAKTHDAHSATAVKVACRSRQSAAQVMPQNPDMSLSAFTITGAMVHRVGYWLRARWT